MSTRDIAAPPKRRPGRPPLSKGKGSHPTYVPSNANASGNNNNNNNSPIQTPPRSPSEASLASNRDIASEAYLVLSTALLYCHLNVCLIRRSHEPLSLHLPPPLLRKHRPQPLSNRSSLKLPTILPCPLDRTLISYVSVLTTSLKVIDATTLFSMRILPLFDR